MSGPEADALLPGPARLKALVVDDEALARQRLTTLLARLSEPVEVLAELGDAGAAWAWLEAHPGQVQLCFLDIQMPGPDGLRLADKIGTLPQPPQVVFVTAHAEHALRAFELEASDYLTKPVRQDRLAQAVARCRKRLTPVLSAEPSAPASGLAPAEAPGLHSIVVHERGLVVRVPVAEVLYLKAEQKYVTLRTAQHTHVIDSSLNELQDRLGPAFLRVHRNALVAHSAIDRLERQDDPDGSEGWVVRVRATGEWLTVSRRQVGLVRGALNTQ